MNKYIITILAFIFLYSFAYADTILTKDVLIDGKSEVFTNLDNETWYNIECKYEYKNNIKDITNCILGIAKTKDLIPSFLLLKYIRQQNLLAIVGHNNWIDAEAYANVGSDQIIENDYAYIDCKNSFVKEDNDEISVTWRIKFKNKFTGDHNIYLFSQTNGDISTGFVPYTNIIIGDIISQASSFSNSMPKEWTNSLKYKGLIRLNLSKNNKANYVIVIPDNPTAIEKKAAFEISYYFELMSKTKFKIVKESELERNSKFISVGNTNILQKSNSKYKKDNLSTEGYAVDIINNNLYIYGGSKRGLLNGIYSLLEEDLGCRWYTKDATYIPKLDNFSVIISPREFIPVLDLRDPFIFEAWNTDWSLKNKTNTPYANIPLGLGGSIKYKNLVHTFSTYFPTDEYFPTHPEYYSLINGTRNPAQLCNTNEDVIRLSIEKTLKIFRDDPSITITSISPNDGRGFCDCPNCKKLDDANGGRSGSYFNLVNKVAEGIKKEFPDKKILALAYLDYANPPTNMKIADNVVVQLCTDAHAWKYQFCYTWESKEFQNYLKKWNKSGAQIFIWDYISDYVHYLVPMANMPVVSENIRFYIKNGADGIMLQGAYMANGSDMSDMRSWVWAKQLWNSKLDTKSLMKDFIYGFYQESAKPIWDYQMMQWNYWEKYHKIPHVCGEKSDNPLLNNLMCSYDPDGPMITKEFMDNFRNYISEAEKLAKSDDILWKVKKVKASLLYLEMAQNVGYFKQEGNFVYGKDFKNGRLENKEENIAILNEFKDITKHLKIDSLSEQNGYQKITDKWDSIISYNGVVLPHLSLSNEWLFAIDKDNKGLTEKWYSNQKYYDKIAKFSEDFGGATAGIDSDGTSRIKININAGWEAQGYPDYDGYGWYFQTFKLNEEVKKANNKLLYFGGVDEEAWVYINGKLVFEHTIAATGKPASTLWNEPFMIDVTNVLNQDGINNIAVRVYDSSNMGGIWQPITLFGSDREVDLNELTLL